MRLGPRANASIVLVLGGIVLLIAIAVGNNMGNRVLGQVAARTEVAPTPLVTPVTAVKDKQTALGWKKTQVISVATDPGFPDPRLTPIPPATPRPRPAWVPGPATPSVTDLGSPAPSPSPPGYTSPPLLLPLATHEPGYRETEPPPDPAVPPAQ